MKKVFPFYLNQDRDLPKKATGFFRGAPMRSLRTSAGLVVFVGVLFAGSHCSAGDTTGPTITPERTELLKIKEAYKKSECIQASFDLRIQNQRENRRARGALIADSLNDRMNLVLREPLFGIQVSEIIVSDGKVFVDNVGEPEQVMPLSVFEVSGLGTSDIVLPFDILKDLMFGTIPDPVFEPRAKIKRMGDDLNVELAQPDGNYLYTFRNNRLSEIQFQQWDSGETIHAVLTGQTKGSMYPGKIEIKGLKGGRVLETMSIRFLGVKDDARCSGSAFEIPSHIR